MSFSGADPTLLRALAGHMEHEVAPLLRRNAAVALDVLERQDLRRDADLASFRLMTLALWAEDAAVDLRRRAGIVESAQHNFVWAPAMDRVHRSVRADAAAVVEGRYTGDVDSDIADHTMRLAAINATDVVSSLRTAIEEEDPAAIAKVATRLEQMEGEPWFDLMAARVFTALGPIDTARVVAVLLAVPVHDHDETTLIRLASAFAVATRSGLGWTEDDVTSWLDQGETGVAQLLRAGPVDASFLALVVTTAGWTESPDDRAARGDPSLRRLLAPGADLWSRVGTAGGDHRAVLLDALGHHPGMAVSMLAKPGTLEMLLADQWPIDDGAALGRLLERIDAEGDAIDPVSTSDIRRRLLTYAADPGVPMPGGVVPALGAVASRHVDDLAFSLAVTGPVVETTARPGLELDPTGVRHILRLIAHDDDAFDRLLIGYGRHVSRSIETAAGADDAALHLASAADELGALTFALAYVDRHVRDSRAQSQATDRLTPLRVLGFLAMAGSSLLPGPFDTAASQAVDQILERLDGEEAAAGGVALSSHNEWKERLLDDLEYLIALDMARHGLLPGLDPDLARVEFLYALEDVDGRLERIMAIVETQARRQREAVEESR